MNKKKSSSWLTLPISLASLTVLGFLVATVWLVILGRLNTLSIGLAVLVLVFLVSYFLPPRLFLTPTVPFKVSLSSFSHYVNIFYCILICVFIYALVATWIMFSLDLLVLKPIFGIPLEDILTPRYDLQLINFDIRIFRSNQQFILPGVLWYYALATAPWSYFIFRIRHYKDGFSEILLAYVHIAVLLNAWLIGFTDLGILTILLIFAIVTAVCFLNGIVLGAFAPGKSILQNETSDSLPTEAPPSKTE